MILERWSEGGRQELKALTREEWRALAYELTGDLPSDVDPALREFLETVEKQPLIDPRADPVPPMLYSPFVAARW